MPAAVVAVAAVVRAAWAAPAAVSAEAVKAAWAAAWAAVSAEAVKAAWAAVVPAAVAEQRTRLRTELVSGSGRPEKQTIGRIRIVHPGPFSFAETGFFIFLDERNGKTA